MRFNKGLDSTNTKRRESVFILVQSEFNVVIS